MVERRQSNNAPTRALLTEFDRLHRAHLAYPAVIRGGKDAKLIAGLWKSHGEQLVKELMADFFVSADPFIRQSGYTVGVFLSQAGKLIARKARTRPIVAEDWFDECKRVHGGACGLDRFRHLTRMDLERAS